MVGTVSHRFTPFHTVSQWCFTVFYTMCSFHKGNSYTVIFR